MASWTDRKGELVTVRALLDAATLPSTPEEEARMERARQRIKEEEERFQREEVPVMLTASYSNLTRQDVRTKTFAALERKPELMTALRVFDAWTPKRSSGYLLYGPPGTGKTHLLKALCVRWATTSCRVHFESFSSYLDRLRAQMDQDIPDDVAGKVAAARIVCLDDVGAEKSTDWTEEQLLALLDRRLEQARPLFISSNLEKEELANRYHRRVIDRMMELMVFVHVAGASHRRTIYANNAKNGEDK